MADTVHRGLLQRGALLGLVLVVALRTPIHAAFAFRPVGARAGGMGDTFAALAEGAEAVFWNPGAIARAKGTELTAGYERPFGMGELALQSIGAVMPLPRGAVGIGYVGHGFSLYREQTVGLTYACGLSSRLALGAAVRTMHLSVEGLEGHRWAAFDLGARARLSETVSLGLSAWNVSGQAAGVLGQGGMAGIGFAAAPGVTAVIDVRKEAGTPTSVSAGLEYSAGDRVLLRTGAGSGPERLSLGLGLIRRWLQIDYAAIHHNVLGVSHRVSLTVLQRRSR